MKIKDISTVSCQQFLMKMYTSGRTRNVEKKGNGLSAKTVKDIKIALQTCLQKAEDEGLIDSNPCRKVQLPKAPPKEMQTLKANELGAFLQETKDSGCYEFYILEITTGLRLGEILALTWDDLDIKNKTISVNKQVQRIKSELKITTPKTASSIRTVALCDECFNQLILLRSRQRLDTKLIFPSPITGGLRDPSSVTRKLHRMQKRAGVPQIRFHDLRHSFATLSLEQGMDIKTVSHMLGHTDAGFTMNTYMHVTDNMQQTVANAMGNLIAETENKQKNKLIHFSA
ncbi:MAG: tyrosine-type recombinase/integrase, partial [Eubacterium sp.]